MTESKEEWVHYNLIWVNDEGRRFVWESGFTSLDEARSELARLQSEGFTGTYTIERTHVFEIERVTL